MRKNLPKMAVLLLAVLLPTIARVCRVERPDGMRVDAEGKLWIAARDGVRAFAASGKAAGKIQVAEQPANLSFGEADRQTLYITARTSLYRIRLEVPGVA